jgi:menaquinone-9 beta-reductase
MNTESERVIIIGGGLAGLSLSILLARSDIPVLVLEKESYPRQKVCGEYIAMESYDFLSKLGLPLKDMELPNIDTLNLTFPGNKKASCRLPVGGFGISRYTLDKMLADIAIKEGVELVTSERVLSINKSQTTVTAQKNNTYSGKLIIGAFGRVSGLDKTLNRKQSGASYIGVKYHVHADLPENLIEIHAFPGGYCGISKVDQDKYCMCYLVKSEKLKAVKGDIDTLEQEVLGKNEQLKSYFSDFEKVTERVTTSQFSFSYKESHQGNLLFSGDAAGFIPPITGNGMSLAFRSALMLSKEIIPYYRGKVSKEVLISSYSNYGNKYLRKRITKGNFLQELLLNENKLVRTGLIYSICYIPGLLNMMSKQAIGKPLKL